MVDKTIDLSAGDIRKLSDSVNDISSRMRRGKVVPYEEVDFDALLKESNAKFSGEGLPKEEGEDE